MPAKNPSLLNRIRYPIKRTSLLKARIYLDDRFYWTNCIVKVEIDKLWNARHFSSGFLLIFLLMH